MLNIEAGSRLIRRVGGLSLLLILVAACGVAAPEPPDEAAASTVAVPAPQPSPDDVTTTTLPPPSFAFPPVSWPEPQGDPMWATPPLGLPASTHLSIGYGPRGFILIGFGERGAVVWLSPDGATWTETAILTGPDGEEQVSVSALTTSNDEYLVVAETWTNKVPGPEVLRYALWRSPDSVSWTVTDLDTIEPDFQAAAIVPTPSGLVLAGTVYNADTGYARPKVWLETGDGIWSDLSAGTNAFDVDGWLEGAILDRDGMIAWGTTKDGDPMIWRTEDLQTWTRSGLPDAAYGHLVAVTPFRGGYVAAGQSKTWVSPDGVEWFIAATAEDFVTDAASEGGASFRRLLVQDGYLVALASVGYRGAAEWCYLDPSDCRRTLTTVLVSGDAKEWRRLPLPGEFEEPIDLETEALLVDGRMTVLHSVGGEAAFSTLLEVANARPLNTGEAPDLPFTVARPGDEIDIGVRYGYPIFTECGLPTIGPLNGTNWRVEEASISAGELYPMGPLVYGFIELTADDQLDYIIDDQVIARYRPDPEATPGFCS